MACRTIKATGMSNKQLKKRGLLFKTEDGLWYHGVFTAPPKKKKGGAITPYKVNHDFKEVEASKPFRGMKNCRKACIVHFNEMGLMFNI